MAFVLAQAFAPSMAHAENCQPPDGISPCVDSDQLWLPASPSVFASIPWAPGLKKHELAVGLTAGFLDRPVALVAQSPAIDGRTVRLVNWAAQLTAAFTYGLTDRVDIRAVAPFTLYQSGAGVGGAISQNPPGITEQAVRDPRLGVSFVVTNESEVFALASELDLALPIHTDGAFAGAIGPVLEADFVATGEVGSLFYGALAGIRMLRTVSFSTTQVGTSADVRLGVGWSFLSDGRLTATLEGWMLPSLLRQDLPLPDGGAVTSARVIPAEWMASVSSAITGHFSVQLGAGTGVPWSAVSREAPNGASYSDTFAAVPSPRFRGMVRAWFTPRLKSERPPNAP